MIRTVCLLKISSYNDLEIKFNDDIVIQIFPDSLEKGKEYYRYIEFRPHIDDDNCKSEHYVIYNNDGVPVLLIETSASEKLAGKVEK